MSSKVVNAQPINDRVRQAVEAIGVSQREIARQVGVSGAFVSLVCQAKSQPSVALLVGLRQVFNVSLDWLMLGEGGMWQTPPTPTSQQASRKPAQPVLVHLAEQASELDAAAIDHLETYMRGFLAARAPQAQRARAG